MIIVPRNRFLKKRVSVSTTKMKGSHDDVTFMEMMITILVQKIKLQLLHSKIDCCLFLCLWGCLLVWKGKQLDSPSLTPVTQWLQVHLLFSLTVRLPSFFISDGNNSDANTTTTKSVTDFDSERHLFLDNSLHSNARLTESSKNLPHSRIYTCITFETLRGIQIKSNGKSISDNLLCRQYKM